MIKRKFQKVRELSEPGEAGVFRRSLAMLASFVVTEIAATTRQAFQCSAWRSHDVDSSEPIKVTSSVRFELANLTTLS
jgi:hypothetical protein